MFTGEDRRGARAPGGEKERKEEETQSRGYGSYRWTQPQPLYRNLWEHTVTSLFLKHETMIKCTLVYR